MNLNRFHLLIIGIIIFVLLTSAFQVWAISKTNDTGISLQVTGPPVCNNNGICEAELGENYQNCPLDCPPPPPPPGAIFLPDTTPPIIYNLLISEITLNSAKITWETDEFALCQLFWGKTQEYELETITETGLNKKHLTKLINLLAATTYHFKISCRDSAKNESETTDQRFTTLTPPDITPPANVSNFEAIPGDDRIELKWQNPPDSDFKAVKIMRSTDFYPSDPWTGIPIYNDKGESFVDTGLTNGVRYYYTAFAYDYAGNYSSGAVVSATPFKIKPPPLPEEITTEEECIKAGYYWYDNACHAEPKAPPPPPEIEKITINEFDFIQEEKKILPIEGKIQLKPEKPLTNSIDYEKVPEVLKTIMITLEKDKKTFSFLLRINKEKTRYEAIIIPPEPGTYPLTITILDYKNQTLKIIKGQLIVEGIEKPAVPIPWYKQPKFWLYILLILLILAGIAYLIRKKLKEKKQKSKTNYELRIMNYGNKNPNS